MAFREEGKVDGGVQSADGSVLFGGFGSDMRTGEAQFCCERVRRSADGAREDLFQRE